MEKVDINIQQWVIIIMVWNWIKKTLEESTCQLLEKELIAGGDIAGIRDYFFFDQQDFYFTLDVEETLKKWDTQPVINRLEDIMKREHYDFLFLLLPS